jgi:hypothetical protein
LIENLEAVVENSKYHFYSFYYLCQVDGQKLIAKIKIDGKSVSFKEKIKLRDGVHKMEVSTKEGNNPWESMSTTIVLDKDSKTAIKDKVYDVVLFEKDKLEINIYWPCG